MGELSSVVVRKGPREMLMMHHALPVAHLWLMQNTARATTLANAVSSKRENALRVERVFYGDIASLCLCLLPHYTLALPILDTPHFFSLQLSR